MCVKRALAIAAVLAICLSGAAFAVIDPIQGVATPNGDYVYVPNQIGTPSINVIDNHANVVPPAVEPVLQTWDIDDGNPASLAVSPNGSTLYVVVAGPSGTEIRSFKITNGILSDYPWPNICFLSNTSYTAGRQCVLSPDGKYLYVANSDNSVPGEKGKVFVIDVQNPSDMKVIKSFYVDLCLWGIAMKPDGTRLYVATRNPTGQKIYVYNTAGGFKTDPQPVAGSTITLGGTSMDPTYLAVNSEGTRLFVRVLETTSPYRDVLVYNISSAVPSFVASVSKPSPGDHLNPPAPHADKDTRNGYEGLALSTNGTAMYFSHYNGISGDGMNFWREYLYGVSVASPATIWEQYGLAGNGWHSCDGVITTRHHKLFMTYSDNTTGSPVYLGVITNANSFVNDPPTAPTITNPSSASQVVTSNMTWTAAIDESPSTLIYNVQAILKTDLEAGNSSWFNVAAVEAGGLSTPFYNCTPGQNYYVRIRAYDGTYIGPWAYSDWFTLSGAYLMPPNAPAWLSNSSTTTTQTSLMWAAVAGVDGYNVTYGVSPESSTYTVTLVPPTATFKDNITTGIVGRTWYKARVRAYNATGPSATWTYDDFYTIPAPNNVHSTAVTVNSATIAWDTVYLDAGNTIPCTSYEVSWGAGTDAVGGGVKVTSGTTINLTGLTGSSIYVKVRADDLVAGVLNGYSDWAPVPALNVPLTGGTGSVTWNFVYNDPNINSSDNWIPVPFVNAAMPNASTLATLVGLPANSTISKWDAVNQMTTSTYVVGGGAPDYAINVGDVLDIYPAGPVASYVFSGSIPASDTGLFTIIYNDPNINSSDNWIYLPPSKSSVNTASALATNMALPANSTISKWDAVNQMTTSTYVVGGGAPDYAINVGDVLDIYPAGTVPVWP